MELSAFTRPLEYGFVPEELELFFKQRVLDMYKNMARCNVAVLTDFITPNCLPFDVDTDWLDDFLWGFLRQTAIDYFVAHELVTYDDEGITEKSMEDIDDAVNDGYWDDTTQLLKDVDLFLDRHRMFYIVVEEHSFIIPKNAPLKEVW